MTGLLDGVRVLDFTWVWSGPMVGSALADLGAEVIKIEHRGRLDNARLRGRPMKEGQPVPGPPEETSPYFHQNNRGKLSLALNIKSLQGLEIANRLVRRSDIILDNFTPGTLERLGLGYRAVSGINRQIIMLSMSAAGATGPRREMRGYAPIMTAMSGLESLVGYPGEGILGMPTYGIGDPNAASHALAAVLAALVSRERFGGGSFIDLSQTEAMVSTLGAAIGAAQFDGVDPERRGDRRVDRAPSGSFACRGDDRWIAIEVRDDADWEQLAAELAIDDPDFSTAAGRLAGIDHVERAVSAGTLARDRDELFDALRARGVPCAPVLNIGEVLADPHFASRGITRRLAHPLTGTEDLVTVPWLMGDATPQTSRPAPLVGEHTRDILTRVLEMDEAEIKAYEMAGALE